MGKENFSKIKLLKIWEILKQDTDEDHPLSTNQLIAKLADNGIVCDRKTLYNDIQTLNSYGYEVFQKHSQHSNQYYIVDRSFDIPELRVLMDAVQASSFITQSKSLELIDKISALAGSYRADLLKKNIVQFNTTKHTNESVFYNVDEINNSIINSHKVSFCYFDLNIKGEREYRKEGNRYLVNPVATVFSNDNYYLLCCHDNHKGLTSYRIDRMSDVKQEPTNIIRASFPKQLDVSDHRKQAFSMFSGDSKQVTFESTKDLLDVIFDKFGEDTKIKDCGDNKIQFTSKVQISDMFFGWCASFNTNLKIITPKSLVEEYKEYLKGLVENYES